MAKLPTSLLARTSTLLTTTARPTILSSRTTTTTTTTTTTAHHSPHQVRHATAVTRVKRPFTWTQIVQLSDGSTYTVRTTSPQPVYRSTKDTRNHLTWQPSDPSLQNVEIDEAGKLAGFRTRFGLAFDLAPGAALAAKEMREDAMRAASQRRRRKQGEGRKSAARRAEEEERVRANVVVEEVVEEKEEETTEDASFAGLMGSYVRDQPSLKGGQTAGKRDGSKKGKKK